jgi:hypothetical protein
MLLLLLLLLLLQGRVLLEWLKHTHNRKLSVTHLSVY